MSGLRKQRFEFKLLQIPVNTSTLPCYNSNIMNEILNIQKKDVKKPQFFQTSVT